MRLLGDGTSHVDPLNRCGIRSNPGSVALRGGRTRIAVNDQGVSVLFKDGRISACFVFRDSIPTLTAVFASSSDALLGALGVAVAAIGPDMLCRDDATLMRLVLRGDRMLLPDCL